MRVFILTLGSRGDVQPYVALGRGLVEAGHQATICTSSSFEDFIKDHGVSYAYMNNEILKLIDTDAGREAVEESRNLLGWMKTSMALMKRVRPLQAQMIDDAWKAVETDPPDLILYHPKAMAGPHLAEKLAIPRVMSVPLPIFTETSAFPSIVFPTWRLGGSYNRLTYRLSVRLAWQQYRGVVNKWRRDALGLQPLPMSYNEMELDDGSPTPTVYPYSEHVVPRPADWPDSTIACGYWFLDRLTSWEPPDELERFLADGPPPVYIGYGSMAGRDPARKAEAARGALQLSGQRGILATGWGGLEADDLPPTVLKIEGAPHDWLFERVSALVHHGGAGTTAAGLRAGKPTIVCPFFGDQPFWGARVAALGVGAEPIPQKKLTAERLGRAIAHVTSDADILRRASSLSERIRAEDGVAEGVAFVERVAAGGDPVTRIVRRRLA